ncbi:hypothetical protein H6771_02630 [Candidatus Peribacteria bacterium]|nr:hypothetical protein [Candidatus Peribacteria bacterium]
MLSFLQYLKAENRSSAQQEILTGFMAFTDQSLPPAAKRRLAAAYAVRQFGWLAIPLLLIIGLITAGVVILFTPQHDWYYFFGTLGVFFLLYWGVQLWATRTISSAQDRAKERQAAMAEQLEKLTQQATRGPVRDITDLQ